MATVNKDFKIKNGLIVADGATFGGTITASEPTLSTHLATRGYTDTAIAANTNTTLSVLATAPTSPDAGELYFDTVTSRINVFYDSAWITIATISDSEELAKHIHDTAIGGTGFVVSRFYDGGAYNAAQATAASGGFYNTTTWVETWDGGSAVDNFN